MKSRNQIMATAMMGALAATSIPKAQTLTVREVANTKIDPPVFYTHADYSTAAPMPPFPSRTIRGWRKAQSVRKHKERMRRQRRNAR